MTRIPAVFALATLALVAGCASGPHHAPSPFDRSAQEKDGPGIPMQDLEISVTVHNEHWLPMRVWVDWPGDWHFFLGDVPPETATAFRVPGNLVERNGNFRLFAEASGSSDDVLTEPIDVRRGRQVEFFVRGVMSCSRTRVW